MRVEERASVQRAKRIDETRSPFLSLHFGVKMSEVCPLTITEYQCNKGVVYFFEDVTIVKKLKSDFNNITTNNVPIPLVEFSGKAIGTK
ncbi:hypothetical protein LIER_11972 [Lithospermum erythrorhizon]|uniref:Uncharacterized protein n=1 Tax=Lithospermum erythrorhizon TaxID=34254 RepID=A0AAV3PQ29_LITER